ncbi:MAG: hypothetical protein EHM24_21395 [Acidobacteria bacterium]|nr:MAG: hypothetical protein EHM24_21395 [Acidobacteriota bacterium]
MKKALVCLVMLAAVLYTAPAFAQTSGWLDVNVGAAVPAEGARNTTYNWTDYGWGGEQATLAVDYKQLTGANIDVGGGGTWLRARAAHCRFPAFSSSAGRPSPTPGSVI